MWKTVYEKQGINCTKQGRGAFICAKCAPQSIPCIAKGKVFALGNTGRVYALDSSDGTTLWESDLGGTFKRLEAIKAQARKTKHLPDYGRKDLAHGPVYTEGVVVCYDDASSLIGFCPYSKIWNCLTCGCRKRSRCSASSVSANRRPALPTMLMWTTWASSRLPLDLVLPVHLEY